MNDKEHGQGFEAQALNIERGKNPYISKAIAWDQGWIERKTQELIHRLEKDKVEALGNLEFGIVRTAQVIDRYLLDETV